MQGVRKVATAAPYEEAAAAAQADDAFESDMREREVLSRARPAPSHLPPKIIGLGLS